MAIQIQIESEVIQNALRMVSRLAPPISGCVTLESLSGKLKMHSGSDLSRCSILLPCRVRGTGVFAISVESLGAATKGRKTLECMFDRAMFRVKAGFYKAELTTVDAIPLDEVEQEKSKAWKVTAEQALWLKQAVSAVALKPTALLSSFMPVSIKLTDRAAFVSCYDNHHMAFLNDKEIQGDLDVTLPLDTLNAVLDTVSNGSFRMQVSNSTLRVSNPIVTVYLSLPSVEDGQVGTADVILKAKEALRINGRAMTAAKSDIVAFLENARAVSTKERSEISILTERGRIRFAVHTTSGNAKMMVKADVKAAIGFKVDYDFFDEAIRKCPEEVEMKIVDGAFVSFRTRTAHVLVSLNQ